MRLQEAVCANEQDTIGEFALMHSLQCSMAPLHLYLIVIINYTNAIQQYVAIRYR